MFLKFSIGIFNIKFFVNISENNIISVSAAKVPAFLFYFGGIFVCSQSGNHSHKYVEKVVII
jgi:hypothetical protein